MKQHKENVKLMLGFFAVAAMVLTLLTMVATSANAQPPKCDNSITSCGCTIGASGDYSVDANLSASQGLTIKNGCIDIEGQNIKLYMGYPIIGPGSSDCGSGHPKLNFGVGIHVLPTADSVSINFANNGVCGWNYGLESEGTNISWIDPNTRYNNVGVLLNGATANNVEGGFSGHNVTGVEISGGSGNAIIDSQSSFNSQYGYWVDGSKENTLFGNLALTNNLAGFYLGCSSKGMLNPLIPCTITTTTGNSLAGNHTLYNKFGIAVERESIYNQIEYSFSNSNTKFDMADGNGNCVYNTYLDNLYITKNLHCIQ
jgi:hypothetical protein